MWTPKEFKAKPKKMDFSSSGQGTADVTAIYADDETLANAIELMDFESDRVQFHVCDQCGFPGCTSGNWLSIRKIGELVLMLPAFREMDRGAWEASEYDPPYFTRVKGSILMDNQKYRELTGLISKLPNIETIKSASSYEIARLLQWEAPFRVLGDYPEPITFRHELLSTTSFPDDDKVVQELLEVLRHFESDDIAPELTSIVENDEKFLFFLDAPNFVEWLPLVRKRDARYGLILKNSHAVVESKQG